LQKSARPQFSDSNRQSSTTADEYVGQHVGRGCAARHWQAARSAPRHAVGATTRRVCPAAPTSCALWLPPALAAMRRVSWMAPRHPPRSSHRLHDGAEHMRQRRGGGHMPAGPHRQHAGSPHSFPANMQAAPRLFRHLAACPTAFPPAQLRPELRWRLYDCCAGASTTAARACAALACRAWAALAARAWDRPGGQGFAPPRAGRGRACSTICAADSCARRPRRPVRQNWQFMPQPTWLLTHSVVRGRPPARRTIGMSTASTAAPAPSPSWPSSAHRPFQSPRTPAS